MMNSAIIFLIGMITLQEAIILHAPQPLGLQLDLICIIIGKLTYSFAGSYYSMIINYCVDYSAGIFYCSLIRLTTTRF